MTTLWLDFETRSRCDITTHGGYVYAADPSTQIMIAAYALDVGPIRSWSLLGSGRLAGRPLPLGLLKHLRNPAVEIRAHNATFERLVLKHCWKLDLPPSRFHCTMYQARSTALPASLADVGRALSAKLQKDPRGRQLIDSLSVPQEDGTFNEDPQLYEEFRAYCERDVAVMRAYSTVLPPLSPEQRALYAANEIINDAGVPIDRELCTLALGYADTERAAAKERVHRLTNGELTSARGMNLTKWLYARLPDQAKRLMQTVRRRHAVGAVIKGAGAGGEGGDHALRNPHGTGEAVPGLTLDKDTRAAIFALIEESPEHFDPDAVAVLEANDATTSASVYNSRSMLERVSDDGRLRGAFVPAGASGTGRFSSKGCQLHNFPRVTARDPEEIKGRMARGADLGGPVLETLKSMLRPTLCARPRYVIVRADWSNIEARVLPWLTARAAAVLYLDAFRDRARDVYLEQAHACGLGGHPKARDAGKVVVLALGYGGGANALAAMCKGYKVDIPAKDAVVRRWRLANPWAGSWWKELDESARWTLIDGKPRDAGRVSFSRLDWGPDKNGKPQYTLVMHLPSGRSLYYPYAEIREGEFYYLKAAWYPKVDATEWPRAKAWGGLFAENATQAVAADLLRIALAAAVEAGLPVVAHVHDEIVCECRAKDAIKVMAQLQRIMLQLPQWAAGLPLAVEASSGPRYRK